MNKKKSIIVSIVAISLIYIIYLNVNLNNSKKDYNELQIKYEKLSDNYKNQIQETNEKNKMYVEEIESLKEQYKSLLNELNELVDTISILKENIEKLKQ